MRMRFKPYAHDELMAADFHVHEPLIWGGRWHAQYARPEQPFVLELGCGKGGFISQLASASGDVRALTKALNAALNGRGGGKPGICQVSCAAAPEQVEEFLRKTK